MSAEAPKDLIGFLNFYLVEKRRFSCLTASNKFLVKYGPWITVVLLVLSLPALLVMLGIGTALVPFGGVGYAAGFGYLTVVMIVQLGLTVAALPGLFARKMSGWTLLFLPAGGSISVVSRSSGSDRRRHSWRLDQLLHPLSGALSNS